MPVYEKYCMLFDELGGDKLADALYRAMGDDKIEEYLDYIARCYDVDIEGKYQEFMSHICGKCFEVGSGKLIEE